ncbi:type IV toxin-antitoxin system AbiEi family antitoxin [Chitinophaga sp. sic0106]|uniref:type IV toxin-antitoxin system AbiEi family antitoxin n=1 Tax=Chitinophaga sp. sic0106 TaxID=2854785 RepID=UPI001C45397F|nr:type IV toxin-antitoxin system AbiEi family antitoxin [Chitinophaga sp. sic0106]MBV7533797.1 type IV toxin-antitoxin system AbiEi family antitoxin [Chitinophaga sp. sic0106]
MGTNNESKLNRLFSLQPPGVVLQSDWLVAQGYSHDLQQRYKKGNWLTPIGTGAFIRASEPVSYEGAVYALQNQSKLSIHPGGRTALSLLGKAHYLELAPTHVFLFGYSNEKLPAWFRKREWHEKIIYYPTSFLPMDVGLTSIEMKSLQIVVSNAPRALMECLYLAPDKQDLQECYELMEGLNGLVPKQVQLLLEVCNSVKVKRLFVYMAEKAGHQWFKYLNIERVNFGIGVRSIVKNGIYVDKYKITVPKEFEQNASKL